jgi:hypothetical protein
MMAVNIQVEQKYRYYRSTGLPSTAEEVAFSYRRDLAGELSEYGALSVRDTVRHRKITS